MRVPVPPEIRILLTGPTGQVGFELQRRLSSLGDVIAVDRSRLNLSSKESIRQTVRSVRPGIIVNAAAYTSVDCAEKDAESAMEINGTAPGVLAQEAKEHGAILVHYSSDYVFDGTKRVPYEESDATAPLNQYGKSKLAGENNIRQIGGAYFILRTSWVYSTRLSNFFLKMLELGRERELLRVVNDQVGSPTSAAVVADATVALLQSCGPVFENASRIAGIYHATCSGATSWFEFAREIFSQVRAANVLDLKVSEVLPISSSQYPSPAQRPSYSVLCCHKISQACVFRPPNWQEELSRVIAAWGSK